MANANFKTLNNAANVLQKMAREINVKMPSGYYFNIARYYMDNGKYLDAIKNLKSAIEGAPNNAQYYRELSTSYLRLKNYTEALRCINIALKLCPDDPRSNCMKGRILASEGKPELAQKAFEKISDNGDCGACADKYYYLGKTYIDRAEYKKAILNLNHAVKINPKDADFYAELAECYRKTGSLEKSLKYIDAAIRLSKSDYSLLSHRAMVLYKLNSFVLAEREYRRYLGLVPTDSYAWTNLGSLLCKQNKHKEEMECYKKALRYNPKDYVAAHNLSNEYLGEEKYLLALKYADVSLRNNPGSNDAKLLLLHIFAKMKRFGDLRKVLKTIDVKKISVWDDYYTLACAYALIADKTKALHYLRKSIKLDSEAIKLMATDSDLNSLRAIPEFLRLEKTAKS